MASAARATAQLNKAERLIKRFRVRALRPQWYPQPQQASVAAGPSAVGKGTPVPTVVPNTARATDGSVKLGPTPLLPDVSEGTRKGWALHDPRQHGAGEAVKAVNPFLPTRHGGTGKGHWKAPRISLRRQADLVKAARAAGLLHLLPPGPKNRDIPSGKEKYWAHAEREAATDRARIDAENKAAQEARVTKGRKRKETKEVKTVGWNERVQWVGDVPARKGKSGARLYAGKARMFKGHKWERVRPRVVVHRRILMRDMAKRVRRYKTHYKRRRPNPLKPSTSAKAPKLPF